MRSLFLFLAFAALASAADVIPAARRVTWQNNVGVEGGIAQYLPGGANQRTTLLNVVTSYSADNTGATNTRTAIQNAVSAATTGQVVYFPAGLYRVDTGISGKSNITFRGEGAFTRSTSSVAIGTGEKTFTVPAGLPWTTGCGIVLANWQDTTKWMRGTVTSYSGTTLVVDVTAVNSTGTFAEWMVSITAIFAAGGGTFNPVLALGYAGDDTLWDPRGVTPPSATSWNKAISGSPTRGTSTVTVSDGTGFEVGALIRIVQQDRTDFDDATKPMIVHTSGYNWNRQLPAIVTAKSGNDITFSPALPFDLDGALTPYAGFQLNYGLGWQNNKTGIEDLTFFSDSDTTVTAFIKMSVTTNSWIYKCGLFNAGSFHIVLDPGVSRIEIRENFIAGRGNNAFYAGAGGAGIITYGASAIWVENNVINRQFPSIELNYGTSASAFTYNLLIGSYGITNESVVGCSINANHGPHNSFNLYEGNVAWMYQNDGYFGSGSEDTILRNWFRGRDAAVTGGIALYLNRFSRLNNIVGNILGEDSVGVTWIRANTGVGYNTTSASSVSIGTGSKALTVAASLLWDANFTALAYSAADPTKYMMGNVISYSGTTLTIDVESTGGSGTVSDWVVTGGKGLGGTEYYTQVYGLPNVGNGGYNGELVQPTIDITWLERSPGQELRRIGAYNAATTYFQNSTRRDVVTDSVGYVTNNAAKNNTATWGAVASADWSAIGVNGWQSFDLDVYASTLIKGNWNAFDDTIPTHEALGGDTVADSYVYSSKPSFFGSLTWPPVDASNPGTPDYQIIPAGVFFETGEWQTSPFVGATITGTLTVNGTITLP